MDYRYHKLSDHSIRSLLQQHKSLRYEAQIELSKELQNRNSDDFDPDELQETLKEKALFLHSLGFLNDMGYTVEKTGKGITIRRDFWPQITELVGVIVGVLFIFVGMYGLVSLYNGFIGEENIEMFSIIVNLFCVVLGYKGFLMMRGILRFINNLGMKFSFCDNDIELTKRVDFRKQTFKGTPQDLILEETAQHLLLKFKDEVFLIASPKSFVQRSTIQSLIDTINNKERLQQFKFSEDVS